MSRSFLFALLGCLFLCAAETSRREVVLIYPESWPSPVYNLKGQPITAEGIALGRALFYDPLLSADSTVSCASCHLSYTAFTHVDHARSHGIRDSVGIRNSMALVNLAWNKSFMWDGAVNHLDVQALAPLTHPAEMGEELNHVLSKIRRSDRYRSMVEQAFGDTAVTGERVLKALAWFQLTFISAGSKYDRVKRNEPGAVFTDQESRGYALFLRHCNACHTEPLFTNGDFADNGLLPDAAIMDLGRMRVTGKSADSLHFKVPTLRNIEHSRPYMHDGRFETLFEVLHHYTHEMDQRIQKDQRLQGGIDLSDEQQVDLVAFLLTLTDKEFLFNPDLAFPR